MKRKKTLEDWQIDTIKDFVKKKDVSENFKIMIGCVMKTHEKRKVNNLKVISKSDEHNN